MDWQKTSAAEPKVLDGQISFRDTLLLERRAVFQQVPGSWGAENAMFSSSRSIVQERAVTDAVADLASRR